MLETKRFLDPLDRSSEVLFGLIMVLTFTGSLSAAEAGRTEIRAMLIGALGCNFAWGIIDGILYLMGRWAEEGRMLLAWKRVRTAQTKDEAHQIIAGVLPSKIASALHDPEFELIRKELVESPEPPKRYRLGKEEYFGAIGVFLWVFVVTLPVVVPFLFMADTMRALRLSNGIAILMLFVAGYTLGRHAGYPPWRIGVAMVGVGVALVAITIALGG